MDDTGTVQAAERTIQHRAVLSPTATRVAVHTHPEPGPIAIMSPQPEPLFESAIASAGGAIEPAGEETRAILWRGGHSADGLGEFLDEHPGVGWVQLPSAGVDSWRSVMAAHTNVVWTSAKGAYAQPVAEHALTLTLALLRVLPLRIRAASWGDGTLGRSLYGRNIVVIGAGGIALEFLRLLEPFDVRTTVVRRSDAPVAGADRTVPVAQLAEVLPDADVVMVAAALTGDTTGLLGAREFALMKSDAVLVNIARGGLVDTDALVVALREGSIGAAGLDVTDPEPLPDGHPLWQDANCIITPHSADTPDMTDPLLAERVGLNVRAFLDGGEFVGVVDPVAGY